MSENILSPQELYIQELEAKLEKQKANSHLTKDRFRKHYLKNKEKIIQKSTEYNRIRNKTVYLCPCGKTIRYTSMPRHEIYPVHIEYLRNHPEFGKLNAAKLKELEIVKVDD